MAKRKYRRKKEPIEVKQYKNSLGEKSVGLSETYKAGDSLLTGSDDFSYERQSREKEKVRRKPFPLVFLDWWKENWISAILVSVLSWGAISIIDLQKTKAVYEYRIEEIEKDIEKMSDAIPNKEVLELELKNLKDYIKNLDFDELEDRITELEIKQREMSNKESETPQ